MFDFLERLRNEPPASRKRVAIITAFCLTGIIGIVWFMSFSAGSSSVQTYDSGTATGSSPWEAIAKAVTDTAGSVQDFVASLKQDTTTFIASTTQATGTPETVPQTSVTAQVATSTPLQLQY